MSIAKLLITCSVIFVVCFVCCLCILVANRQLPLAACPQRMLWVWERPEDLTWLDSSKFGVAYLDRTIFLSGESIRVDCRRQPMKIPAGTYVMAVVRLESDEHNPAAFSKQQIDKLCERIMDVGKNQSVRAVQIDFDARQNEQLGYKRLLAAVRARLPNKIPLSMTALLSWCVDDTWLEGLPVDEAVPMFFRMGVHESERQRYLQKLTSGDLLAHQIRCKCQDSIGVCTDELFDLKPFTARRIYVFSPIKWQKSSAISLTNQSRFE